MLIARTILLSVSVCIAAACAHVANRESAPAAAPILSLATVTDSTVYDVVLRSIAEEYGRPGEMIWVQSATMEMCDPPSAIYYLDCVRDRDFRSLESKLANGFWAFDSLISDSTRQQLAASFRMNGGSPHLLRGLPPSKFLAATRAQILGEGPFPCVIVLARASYSTNGYAYVYAVFGRQRFGAGMVFLLRQEGSGWRMLSTRGVWVT